MKSQGGETGLNPINPTSVFREGASMNAVEKMVVWTQVMEVMEATMQSSSTQLRQVPLLQLMCHDYKTCPFMLTASSTITGKAGDRAGSKGVHQDFILLLTGEPMHMPYTQVCRARISSLTIFVEFSLHFYSPICLDL
jgi:hypothetical protein